MEVRSSEKARSLAERNGWSVAHAEGYIDGEQCRQSGQAPSRYVLVGFDDYSLGYRAGYFDRPSSGSAHRQKLYWRYTRANGWVVRDPKLTAVICPKCDCRAFRITRRFIDRVVSVVLPVRRYQCESPDCRWEGNIPIDPHSKMARFAANLRLPFRMRSRRACPAGRDDG